MKSFHKKTFHFSFTETETFKNEWNILFFKNIQNSIGIFVYMENDMNEKKRKEDWQHISCVSVMELHKMYALKNSYGVNMFEEYANILIYECNSFSLSVLLLVRFLRSSVVWVCWCVSVCVCSCKCSNISKHMMPVSHPNEHKSNVAVNFRLAWHAKWTKQSSVAGNVQYDFNMITHTIVA